MDNNNIVEKSLNCLGRGFDLTSDFKLKYSKGNRRLVLIDESNTRDFIVPGFGCIKDVSIDIKCDKGDRTRFQSDILTFNQMSEFFNGRSSVPGKIPSGLFNAMFGYHSGSWAIDASNTKYLGLDGYFISLFNIHIDRYQLILSDEVRNAVPSHWDPSALARFIEEYGTHIIVGLSVGGEDVVLVKQGKTSNLTPQELKKHLDQLGDQLFTGACPFSPRIKDHKFKAPQAFNVFDHQPIVPFNNFTSTITKDGITVTCYKRGGEKSAMSHCEWLPTVASNPDAIHFNFIPITSLLHSVPGKGFLSHAINLYLRYKPPVADLENFLDFQVHKIWAPIHNDLPLGPTTNRTASSPSFHLGLMGPKLFVNTTQVTTGNKPVTGIRFYLEGKKSNRLAIHLQHLSTIPTLLQPTLDGTTFWRGSEEIVSSDRYFEPISSRTFAHICTAPVKYNPNWIDHNSTNQSFIVTGARLHLENYKCFKNVLHLQLQFSKVTNSTIVVSNWAQTSSGLSHKSGIFSALSGSVNVMSVKEKEEEVVVDSSVFPSGPPAQGNAQRVLKFVDVSEVCRGPGDSPGHWLVTGARLDLDNGKVCLQVKFSLLNICSSR